MHKFLKKSHYVVLAILLAILIESCSKSDNPAPATTCNLSKLSDAGKTNVLNATYNSSDNISQTTVPLTFSSGMGIETISATYNSSNQLIKIKEVAASATFADTTTYNFSNLDANGNPGNVTRVSSNSNSKTFNTKNYTLSYDANKRLIKSVNDNDSGDYKIYKYDNSGNLLSVTTKTGTGSVEYVSQSYSGYDTKKNPFQGWGQIFILFGLELNPSPNNYLSEESRNSATDNNPTKVTNNYTYNDQGYPTSINIAGGTFTIDYNCK